LQGISTTLSIMDRIRPLASSRSVPASSMDSGAWPLASLRQSFLNGSLTRLVDPDTTLKSKIVEFVTRGDFGLASGKKSDGTYEQMWFQQPVASEEVAFEAGVFLLRKATAESLKSGHPAMPVSTSGPEPGPTTPPTDDPGPTTGPEPTTSMRTLHLSGSIPPEVWNRLGTKILPKLRSGSELKLGLEFSVTVSAAAANGFASELRQILQDLGLTGVVNVE
jgi:hypothetical protein